MSAVLGQPLPRGAATRAGGPPGGLPPIWSSPVKAPGSSQGHPNADFPGEMLLLGQHLPQRAVLAVLHDDGEAGDPI